MKYDYLQNPHLTNDYRAFLSKTHPQLTPWWKRIWRFFKRPKLSGEAFIFIDEAADLTPEMYEKLRGRQFKKVVVIETP